METTTGEILKGEVTKITDFGAFIKLENNDSGLCHVSELSDTFVKNVRDVLKIGQEVSVKVVNISSGKISLSIKQATVKQSTVQKESRIHTKPKSSDNFEGMLSSFIKVSDEKQYTSTKKKKGSRRGNSHNWSYKGQLWTK